jgi:CheY-like chemotaxis protein
VFRVDVPLVGYNTQHNIGFFGAGRSTQTEGRKGLVVIIDDEAIILRGLQVVVEGWGYEAVIAASEAEAMDRLSALDRAPDIIISDYRLRAGKTGIEAIRHIRARYGNRPIPSLLITGDTAPERLQEAEASGYRLLHKPVSSSKLKDVLDAYRTL